MTCSAVKVRKDSDAMAVAVVDPAASNVDAAALGSYATAGCAADVAVLDAQHASLQLHLRLASSSQSAMHQPGVTSIVT